MTPSKTPSIAIGAVTYLVLSLVTSFLAASGGAMSTLGGLLACLVAVVAPVIAVWHYTSTHNVTLLPGQGAGLGAAAAAIGAALSGVIGLGLQSTGLFPSTEEVLDQQRRDLIADGMSPDEVDRIMSMAGGMADNPVLGLAIGVVGGLVAGAFAGAIASLIFKKGEPEM